MAEAALCAGCLRDDEEEKAEFWCCDCGELVCRGCGKAHRRFATPHDVVRLDEVSDFKREVPTECLLHDKKKLTMFCVGHDKLICQECLIKEHSECTKIMEVKVAAKGVQNGSAIINLKKEMEKTKNTVALYRKKHLQKQIIVNANEKKSKHNIDQLTKDLIQRCEQIRNTTVGKYNETKEEMLIEAEKMEQIEKRIAQYIDNICQVEEGTNEVHIFYALKYLEGSIRKYQEELDDIDKTSTQTPDVFPSNFTQHVDEFFDKLNPKKPFVKKNPRSIAVEGAMSQLQVEKPRDELKVNDSIPLKQSEYIKTYQLVKKIPSCDVEPMTCCFVDDKRILVITYNRKFETTCLKIVNFFENTIKLSDVPSLRLSTRGQRTVCMYNEKLALVAYHNLIDVVDIVDLRVCRSIRLHVNNNIKWIRTINNQIHVILIGTPNRLCTVNFNGDALDLCSLICNDLAYVDLDTKKYIYASHLGSNSLSLSDCKIGINFRTFYESLDLQHGCFLQCLPGRELLLSERTSGMMYKLHIDKKIRTVLLKDFKQVHAICTNTTGKLLAVIQHEPMEIQILRAVVINDQ